MKNKLFNWPNEIYMFWLVDFIMGLELIGSILLIFFKDWGGLSQTQTQTLQSWFMLWIFILEIPTGVYGDVKGTKKSVILGHSFLIMGVISYTLIPNILLFFLAEFLFAVGIALISGSDSAWLYDTAERLGLKERYSEIKVTSQNIHLAGMMIGSLLTVLFVQYLPVNLIFRSNAILYILAIILLWRIKGSEKEQEESLKPKYKETLIKAWALIKTHALLKKLVTYISILGTTAYFVIWLYQETLRVLDIPESYYGIYRTILLASEILVAILAIRLLKHYSIKKILAIIAITIALGFLAAGIFRNIPGVIALLVLSGGLGLSLGYVLDKDLNDLINSDQRATVLSIASMLRRLLITILNPVVGLLVDNKGVFLTLTILGIVSLAALYFIPKKE